LRGLIDCVDRSGGGVPTGALRPVALGVLMGLGGALVAGGSISGLLYRVKPTDPAVLLGASVALAAAAATHLRRAIAR